MEIKILVVDDEASACQSIRRFLSPQGFRIRTANNGKAALKAVEEDSPHLVITDADMPGMSGFELCRLLKSGERTRGIPIIMISGKAVDEESVISGFEKGADDYVLKPVSLPLLHARIKAVLRRYDSPSGAQELLRKSGVELDPARRTVKVSSELVELTRKEFDLLTVFLSSGGRVLSWQYLLEEVWGYDAAVYNNPHTVAVHVSRLRKKLGPKIGAYFHKVTGLGYKFQD